MITIKLKTVLFATLITSGSLGAIAQSKEATKQLSDTAKITVGETKNVMLNASADNGPRAVNIGLPASVGGTTVLENGLPVTYDYMGMLPTQAWRQDASISRMEVLNVASTAILASDVGVSVSTYTNRGTEKLKGSVGFTTNSFGLLRGEFGISGPMKNGFYYSASAFVNLDPGTFSPNFTDFLDKTQIYKGVLNKKYRQGQIGVQYKYAYAESIGTKQSPYIYREDGSVDALPGFRIGRDSYLEQSGKIHATDMNGDRVVWDAMKDLSSTVHAVDLLGDHKLDNGLKFDYAVRYQHANSGSYNPYYTAISRGVDSNAAGYTPTVGDKSYYYAGDSQSPYTGYIQNAMMIAAPSTKKQTIMGRFDASKKSGDHDWMVGLHNWYYRADDVFMATYNYAFGATPNPSALGYDEYTAIKDKDGNITDYKWINKTDNYGTRNHNVALQYYDGFENKLALVLADKWKLSDKLTVDLGGRLEWNRMDVNWLRGDSVLNASTGKKEYERLNQNTKKDFWNVTGTASLTWKAFDNLGFLADAMYIQQTGGKISSYAGADDPQIEKSEIPGFSAGVYFNHPMISLVSKVTKISRTNFKNNSTFNNNETGEVTKQTISYGVNTIGWTTDLLLKPAKGFDLHFLLTLQNPKYEDYEFDVFGVHYSNSGNVARSVSKTIIEIDPSYTWGKFKAWASARYFSKEYANYPNTLVFAGRWETFAGLNYKHDKNVDFGVSVVNLLNQSGAQGSISGTNTTTSEQAKALYDQPLSGTYIRPFTVEFKTKIRF